MRRLLLVIAIAAVCPLFASAAAPATALQTRTPALSPDGKTLYFTYMGDIWRAPATGGDAVRLTVHPARDSSPVATPDGQSIVFASDRGGNINLYVMSADGGTPRRLTTGSHDDTPEFVTRDDKWVLFRSNAFGRLDLFKVALAGGPPIRLTWDYWEFEYFGSVSPDGKRIAFDLNSSPGSWRRHGHRTPNSADIWTADFTTPLSNLRQITTNTWQDFNPEWSPDGQWLYYIGSETGTPNLWRMRPDGTGKKQLTFHFEDGARLMHMAADGSAIAYEYLHAIWRYDVASGETEVVPIRIAADYRFNAVNEYAFAGTGVDEYALSPDSKLVGLILHGDVFVAAADGGGTARQITSTPQREEQITWAPDSRRLAYCSMRYTTRDLFVADLRDGSEKRLTSGPSDVSGPAWGPKDDSDIAYLWGRSDIRAAAPDGTKTRTITAGHYPDAYEETTGVVAWSPDGQWLAYSEPGKDWQGDVWVVPSAGGAPKQVAWLSKGTGHPAFAGTGKFVYFSNAQSGDADPYIVDLQPRTPTFEDEKLNKLLAGYEQKPAAPPAAGEPAKSATGVAIDFNRIEERLRRVTALGASVGDIAVTPDGETMLVIVTIGRAGAQLASFPTDPDKPFEFKQLTTAPGGKAGLTIDRQGRNAYFVSGGRLQRVAVAGGTPAPVDFTARQLRDEFAENRAVFDEAWWTLDRMFYDPNHHGADWGAVRREYATLLPHILDKDDLYDMLLEMVHRLDASHLGVTAPARAGFGSEATGYLGVEWDWAELERSGRYRVARVIPDGPAANPNTQLKAGDFVLAVNGEPVGSESIDAVLNRTIGRRTTLSVAAAPGGEERTVALNPISRQAQFVLEYEAWIENCRRLVSEASGGRVGYVHIAAMDAASLTRFKMELTTKLSGTEAAVVDVRFNGGGSTANDLLAILQVRPWVVHTYQGLPYPVSDSILRGYSYERPSACLINQWCFSNSEVFAEGFRQLGIGPVVGWPTSGSVISTGGRGLIDGGFIRTPVLGILTQQGDNLELSARKPDIEVAYDPVAILAGRDPQVERAARELVAIVDAHKPTRASR